jgi:hypothetical protein
MPNRQRKPKKKNAAAVALGRLGGLQRAKTVLEVIPPAKRSMYARHAAAARWAKVRAAKKEKEAAEKP